MMFRYMTLGESPRGEYDIRADLQKDSAELRISLEGVDMLAITFTFPDSMYNIVLNDRGELIESGRTNTPECMHEINTLVILRNKIKIFANLLALL